MSIETKFSREKYKALYETLDDKNKVILYLLSKNKIAIDALCQLKLSDVNENGIGKVELPRKEQAALARYFKASKTITSIEDPIFPARSKEDRFLTPNKLKMSLARIYKREGIEPEEVGVDLKVQIAEISEENIDMNMVLNIIREKLNK